MASTTETVSREGGGPELLVRHWPAVGPAWAAMLIVHGLAEHSGRYEHGATRSPRPASRSGAGPARDGWIGHGGPKQYERVRQSHCFAR